ncbi:MAG: sigma-70 family RNA polymerase sigma factor [Micavibrio aeruginosavorus]|uniref:Sigma-70 family RNA polymerase sigma factor n=1 Tax=Micavibrio aeruginosavorus TaxID=349221 RepID=A0A7T5R3R1_9BACT|nr:MAG: sigma-70 family RNA polymerase sigma factor [Micavibrio aeruginosavorus]
MEDTDEGLMKRVQKGDHQAFSLLVRRHSERFYALSWRLLGNEAEAEDVVQDAFIKLWAQPALFRVDAGVRFTTWFYRVVSNMATDRLRGRKRWASPEAMDILPDPGKGADQALAERQTQALIEKAIHALPERQKLALTLCFYEGLSVREAGAVMEAGEKAVESLLMRAKAGLREELAKSGLVAPQEVRHERTARYR